MKLSSKIDGVARQRVMELLRNPFAGSEGFEPYHPSAMYRSNCHGAMAYVFNLRKNLEHPLVIPADQMDYLVWKNFTLSEPIVGCLAAFYMDSSFLVHTSMLINNSNRVFHQKICGGCFELGVLEEHRLQAQEIIGARLNIKYFKRN